MTLRSEAWLIQPNVLQGSLEQFDKVPDEGYLWLIVPTEELIDVLPRIEKLTQTSINEQHIKDALNPEHPSFFDSTDTYEMVIFRGVANSQFEMDIPHIWLTPYSTDCFHFEKVLLTVCDPQDSVINKVKDFVLKNSRRPNTSTPSDLLYKILNTIIEQTLALRNPLTQQLTEWQRLLLDRSGRFNAWNEFMAFKSTVEQLAIWCEDQEDAIEEWQQYSRHEQQRQQFNINLNDLSDHIERCIRYVQKVSGSLDMLVQLHYSALSHRNNEVLRVLAIISCVFLPLTLITGIFGMNFEHMPVLQQPHAYYITIGMMLLLAAVLLGVFRWRKWL
jgi:Mg2+ and Co2+ transporter CorA